MLFRSAAAPAGPRPARWDAVPANDGPAMPPMELGVAGPVVTPVPGQPEVAYDWWLSASWTPPTPVTATEWRDSLTSGQVVALFGYDPSINWSEVLGFEICTTQLQPQYRCEWSCGVQTYSPTLLLTSQDLKSPGLT